MGNFYMPRITTEMYATLSSLMSYLMLDEYNENVICSLVCHLVFFIVYVSKSTNEKAALFRDSSCSARSLFGYIDNIDIHITRLISL